MRQPPRPRSTASPEGTGRSAGEQAERGRAPGVGDGAPQPRTRTEEKKAAGRRRVEVARVRHPVRMEGPVGAADAAEILGSHEEGVSEGLPARLEERRRARRHLRAVRAAVLVAMLGTVAVVVWAVFASPLLRLSGDAVEVQGATGALSADEVRAAVEPFEGTPLVLLDTDEVARAVSALPLARDVTVARDWPDGVRVGVTVRTAAMAVSADGGVQLVDDQGVVVGEQAERPDGLPLAVLPDDGQAQARTQAAGQIGTVWAALPEDLRAQVGTISSDGAQVTLSLAGGQTVRWGTEEDSDLKARVLAVLLAQRPATTYDVSVPTRPVTS
ncbi:cell division protein FtsQ/DivIB [Schaalia naturae]|uniref:Cell division protein FtsQ/DivIB n=1 Tax=Schaalia naturae TaxID=635203 RepID=A0ABW2SL39_9ACTO